MNAKTLCLLGCLVGAATLLSGCNEKYGTTTVVGRDGSIERTFTLSRRLHDLPRVGFPLPVDASWDTSWAMPEAGKDNATFTARRHFDTMDSLAVLYTRIPGDRFLQVHPRLQSHFRWFFTYHTYTETYERFDPFRAADPRAFLSEDELRRFTLGETSDSLKAKSSAWDSRNIVEYATQRLGAAVHALHDPALDDATYLHLRDSVLAAFAGDTAPRRSPRDRDTLDADLGWDMEKLARVLPHEVAGRLRDTLRVIEKEVLEKVELAMSIDGEYTNTVVMPGIILSTNAPDVQGSSAVWKFSDDQLRMADFVMEVESRTVNTWAVLVTAALAMGLLVLPTAHRYLARKRALLPR